MTDPQEREEGANSNHSADTVRDAATKNPRERRRLRRREEGGGRK